MKVLITPRGFATYGLDEIARMREKGLTVHFNDTGKAYTPEQFRALALDADAIIIGVDQLDSTLMAECKNLKVVCKFGVGTDNIDVDYAKAHNIHVGRTVGSNSRAVAEHVVALMFDESKNLYRTINEVKNHEWNKPTGYELHGKTLGIIGFGTIGKYLASYANGIGMKVLAYDTFEITPEAAAEHRVTISSFEQILEQSDYVSLHIPLLDSTRDLISEKELKAMKSTACLINTARGGIVNEQALYQALTDKEIRSACFDVFSTEPPKADEPLLALDNFFLTPHTAARTAESETRTCEMSATIVTEHLLG